MNDNDLIKAIISIVKAGLIGLGYSDIIVKQSYQPTSQGAETGKTAYLFKLFDRRFGHVGRKDVWDQDTEKMIHTESQWYETTFQISTLVIQNPYNTNSLTSSDLANIICSILQSDFALNSFREQNIGVLRVTEVRNPYFVDDKDRNEASPSFDFILTHERVVTSENPVIVTEDFNFNRV